MSSRVGSLATRAYYKLVFGRDVPFSGRLSKLIVSYERKNAGRDVPLSKDAWDQQYAAGSWEYMKSEAQLARYDVLAGYLRALGPSARILDVGAGEGLLEARLGADAYGSYLGVDLSENAVKRGMERLAGSTRARLVAADASSFASGARFDAVVFNEVLYYFDDPFAVIRHYEGQLSANGVFVASLYENSLRAATIARRIASTYPVSDETLTQNGRDRWRSLVFAPRR